jgi:hypothetical protein
MTARALLTYRSPKARFARSINVERDAGTEAIESYLPVARTVDTLHRIAFALNDDSAERAISITGPYGSGKSSLAVLLDAVLGPAGDPSHTAATDLLQAVSEETLQQLQAARRRFRADADGFIRALVAAEREPVTCTILRALASGLHRFGAKKRAVQQLEARARQLLEDASGSRPRHIEYREIHELLSAITTIAPVLLLIDEFGKNLEAFADSRSDSDLFLLQQLAEWTRGSGGLPLVLVTMQHMAFGDYVDGASAAHRREWAKIQGRFEDVPFVDSAAQTRALIASAFEHSRSRPFIEACRNWAVKMSQEARDAGLHEVADPNLLEACWPLHPLSLVALPELCQRYGQNERTLFSFLAGPEPNGLRDWLHNTTWQTGDDLPCIRLDRVYGYFLEAAATLASVSAAASRWVEVDTRIRDAHGLNAAQRRVVRTVGLLNLIAAGGSLRAAREMLMWAAADGNAGTQDQRAVSRRLDELETAGLITFRDFADEYRVWQGSDFDLKNAIESARQRLRNESVANLLEQIRPLAPLIAGRHSHATGTLRNFARRWVDGASRVTPASENDSWDGTVLYALNPIANSSVEVRPDAKPVVLVNANGADAVIDAALEAAAVREVSTSGERTLDWVAARELDERFAGAIATLDAAFELTFGPNSTDATWALLSPDDGSVVPIPTRGGSPAVSWVADRTYVSAPIVRNDLINRRELTSQAAKARRQLLEAMLQADQPRLGIEGFGPERAMYESILFATGMHREDQPGWRFAGPYERSGYSAVWNEIVATFQHARRGKVDLDDLFRRLAMPPFGVREGLIPVVFLAALLVHGEQVAIYEHGTFKPALTADLLERLVKNPKHFQLKHYASRSGSRQVFMEKLEAQLPPAPSTSFRTGGVLALVARLIGLVSTLPQYTRQTKDLSPAAQAIRTALLTATEPDELLFKAIPVALDHAPLSHDAVMSPRAITKLRDSVIGALEELQTAYSTMLDEVRHELSDATSTPADSLRATLVERARMLDGRVLDQRLRAFLSAVLADFGDDDAAWSEYVALTVTDANPVMWTDEDRRAFSVAVRDIGGTFCRLEALNYDRLARTDGVAEALRVTVTRPDGGEEARVVWIEEAQQDALDRILRPALERATKIMGTLDQAKIALVARAFAQASDTSVPSKVETVSTPASTRKATRR